MKFEHNDKMLYHLIRSGMDQEHLTEKWIVGASDNIAENGNEDLQDLMVSLLEAIDTEINSLVDQTEGGALSTYLSWLAVTLVYNMASPDVQECFDGTSDCAVDAAAVIAGFVASLADDDSVNIKESA